MEKVFTATRSLMLIAFTGANGAITIWMAWHLQWGLVILCGLLTIIGFGFIGYKPDRIQEQNNRFDNPRLRGLLDARKNPERFQKGCSFHSLGIQWLVEENHGDMIVCKCVTPGMPDAKVKFSFPEMLPWGGEEYRTNMFNLRQLVDLSRTSKKERELINKVKQEVANGLSVEALTPSNDGNANTTTEQ